MTGQPTFRPGDAGPQQLHGRPGPVSAPMVRPVAVASAGDAETDRLNAASLEAARAVPCYEVLVGLDTTPEW